MTGLGLVLAIIFLQNQCAVERTILRKGFVMTTRRIFMGAMMLCALWAMLAAAPRAFAQDPNRLSQLKISVWPEYDQPAVLVMLDGTLADVTNLPRQVAVLIP